MANSVEILTKRVGEQGAPDILRLKKEAADKFLHEFAFRSFVLLSCGSREKWSALNFCATEADVHKELKASEDFEKIRLASALFQAFRRRLFDNGAISKKGASEPAKLIPCERGALSWLAQGHHHQLARIAERMGIATVSAKKHINTARLKHGAKTHEQALAMVVNQKLIDS